MPTHPTLPFRDLVNDYHEDYDENCSNQGLDDQGSLAVNQRVVGKICVVGILATFEQTGLSEDEKKESEEAQGQSASASEDQDSRLVQRPDGNMLKTVLH